MPPKLPDLAYAAHAGSNTFLLDEEGICRRILTKGRAKSSKSTQRCLGAQYVASLDFSSESGLVERPKEGCPLLFARVDEHGRVSLVRTAPLERFEEVKRAVDVETDEHPTFEDEPPPTRRPTPMIRPAASPVVPALQPLRRVEVEYRDPHDRTQERPPVRANALSSLIDDDDDQVTIIADRSPLTPPPQPLRRGILPRGRREPGPSPGSRDEELPPRTPGGLKKGPRR